MRALQTLLGGVIAVLGTLPCLAQTPALEFPLDRQVFQRNAEEWAEVKVAGTVPANATLVEVKTELASGLRGKAVTWTVVAQGEQIKDGRFNLETEVPPNTTATVYLPYAKLEDVTEGGGSATKASGVTRAAQQDSTAVIDVGSGRYTFSYPWTK